jgi:hypothetical protein
MTSDGVPAEQHPPAANSHREVAARVRSMTRAFEHEQQRIEGLLAYAESRRWWPPFRPHEVRALDFRWSREIGDPEFHKNLWIFRQLVADAAGIYGRAVTALGEEGAAAGSRSTDVASEGTDRQRRAFAAGAEHGELRERIRLPADVPLTFKVLLARRFELEQLMLELADREYLTGRLAELYNEEKGGTHSTWQSLFGDEYPALLSGPVAPALRDSVSAQPTVVRPWSRPAGSTTPSTRSGGTSIEDWSRLAQHLAQLLIPSMSESTETQGGVASPEDDEVEVESTRWRLARLMHVKEAEDQTFRVRLELKRRAALLVTWVLAIVAIIFAVAVARVVADDRELFAAAAAGAAGAALGGLIRLRDQVNLAAQVRQFRPFFVGQVVIGATAGLVTFLVDQSGIITISGQDTGIAALAFAVGFSEAAFIGLLTRMAPSAGDVEQRGTARPAKPT